MHKGYILVMFAKRFWKSNICNSDNMFAVITKNIY